MTQRERWQALQTHLSAAQAFVKAGDQLQALDQVNAALALDPDFLAAQSLRDRLVKKPEAAIVPSITAPAELLSVTAVPVSVTAVPVPTAPAAAVMIDTPPIVAPAPVAQPVVSAEGYARFEARAKRRRVDRRIEAARVAIERKRLHEAAYALDEIISLDPNLPELARLTAEFDELRKSVVSPHRGPWLMAAAVFAGLVLGASWLHESSLLVSFPVKADVSLITSPTPAVVHQQPVVEEPPAVATAGVRDAQDVDEPEPAPPTRARAVRPQAVPAVLSTPLASERERAPAPIPPLPAPPTAVPAVSETSQPPVAALTALLPVAPPTLPVPPRSNNPAPAALALSAPAPAPAAVVPTAPDDEGLVKQTLQRYRRAYDGLDAQSAHAVWPAVNQTALARAFDGLSSQAITFEACDVHVRGAQATATCRGTARYVPKIGNREPRVEPRVWSFALKKDGADWKIDTARAER